MPNSKTSSGAEILQKLRQCTNSFSESVTTVVSLPHGSEHQLTGKKTGRRRTGVCRWRSPKKQQTTHQRFVYKVTNATAPYSSAFLCGFSFDSQFEILFSDCVSKGLLLVAPNRWISYLLLYTCSITVKFDEHVIKDGPKITRNMTRNSKLWFHGR
ncbi:hypothetical protein EG68_02669 [Paragonimus skrjabini miyazakii]|uniref:Uncharacterized protein n=1 Tax=Paragonimus skrjabini miyazakii TaxID=59628 RepID=A0A8S9YY98_9TREM|nr:hypothetical protein EG68_02669 [Paragonimus skrjabini miyazakii]